MDDPRQVALDAALCHGDAIRSDPVPAGAECDFRGKKSDVADDSDAGKARQ